jgi:hypothetical protein
MRAALAEHRITRADKSRRRREGAHMNRTCLAAFTALAVVACQDTPGPIPVPGNTLVEPTITMGAGTFTIYCDGKFDGSVAVTAVYPPIAAGQSRAKATFGGASATTSTNLDNLSFGGQPMTFASNGAGALTVSGKLVAACDPGTLALSGQVTFEHGGGQGALGGGPYTIGPVAMRGHGPSPDPTANAPNGDFQFDDTLHCCTDKGNATLTALTKGNVTGLSVAPATMSCVGPTPDQAATMAGKLQVPEVDGHVELQVAAGGNSCVIDTTVKHP